jgi:preprotein translocase subunit SecY
MDSFREKLALFLSDRGLLKRVGFVLVAVLLFRALAAVPIPGVDANALANLLSQNQFLGLLNLFSGGGLSSLSIVLLGVGPYITGSIIMQLMTIIFPSLKQMYQEEGEAGRIRFAQYSRLLTLPLAVLQGIAFLVLLTREGIVPQLSPFLFAVNVLIVAAGSLLLMWVGELVSEFGIGQGISLLIFAGIVSRLPSVASQALFTFDISQLPLYLAFAVAAIVIVAAVVFVSEAERPIPVTYAKRMRGLRVMGGGSSYLPLRLNQAGVIPIIFALSVLLLPQMAFGLLASSSHANWVQLAQRGIDILNNQLIYGSAYFVLVFLFTYFYTAVTFDPDQVAENLQRNGAFIPGIRPGQATSEHLAKVITRITLPGALFLGIIAVLPIAMQAATGIKTLAIGGTGLLIVVSVVLDLVRRVDAQLAIREY